MEQTIKEMESSGVSLLKEKRQASGLSLETVHEATKIPLDVLRAIEEGYTVRNLSAFYYKGFLKIYATYLNVDISKVIEDYKSERLPKYIPKAVEENPLQDWQQRIIKFATPERKKQALIIAGIIVGLFIFYQLLIFIQSR